MQWLSGLTTYWADLERNDHVLREVLNQEGMRIEALPYEALRDQAAEVLSFAKTLDGRELHFSLEAYAVKANGDLAVCVDISGLPRRWGIKPSYHFYKRMDGSVYY